MAGYIPNTKAEQLAMLREIGYADFDELFHDIPAEARVKGELDLPSGKSELEVLREMEELAGDNVVFETILRGAGAYNHYVPAAVDAIAGKEEFLTAYTPYQAEISQGILQSIFEYQTMICELTGMDVSNASLYDGGSAAAEACAMTKDRKRSTIYVSDTVDKRILSVIRTYSFGRETEVRVVPAADGATDLGALREALAADPQAACFLMQYPNFYGIVEDADAIAEIVHGAGAQLIMSVNPIALGILKTPGEIGADIVCGEGQPLGLGLAYGGPYLGILATTQKNMRKIVGRVVGETVDSRGERGYVLTLQAREQHIRREKAASNICSNEALCALKAYIYLATVGPEGLRRVAELCTSKAHYLADELAKIGMKRVHGGEFFHEFAASCPDADKLLDALEDNGILGGLKLSDHEILWCTTELVSKADIDDVIEIAKEVFGA
ncbi:MAG: aminomethyl-transferring glycine dehydrogenase subunit GcvPA [Mogibacterium sp.]|nr:aminomethyl-transferring glycine dehydrogenase subunit GcvPA [Mogibacterium sp.]